MMTVPLCHEELIDNGHIGSSYYGNRCIGVKGGINFEKYNIFIDIRDFNESAIIVYGMYIRNKETLRS